MKQKKRFDCRRLLSLSLCLLLVLSVFSFPPGVKADVVTDTLDVCVGYFGMDLSNYVTVGSYHWSELEQNLPIQEAVYSYYNSGTLADEYTAVVDTARGFYIRDLLDYANVYYGDIDTILFYVQDAQTIWVSFDRDTLFCERYYFDDLPGHRSILYGTTLDGETDYSDIEGYDFEDAWNDAQIVEPMLALEDNWASFNEEFEHIGPDDSYMNTGSRFRLLFGQLEPTESRTHDSAKYVSRVYVTLTGSPHITEDSLPAEFDGSLGSHDLTLDVNNIYNQDMTDALKDYLDISSTDDSVLVIDGVDTSGTGYSDLAEVTIHYRVVGEGSAAISMSIGGQPVTVADSQGNAVSGENGESVTLNDFTAVNYTAPEGADSTDQPETTPADNQASDNTGGETAGETGQETAPAASAAVQPVPSAAAASGQSTGSVAGSTQTASPQPSPAENTTENITGTDNAELTEAAEQAADTEPAADETDALLMAGNAETFAAGSNAFLLSPGASSQLTAPDPAVSGTAAEEVTQLQVEDTTAEDAAEEKRMLLFTCLALLGICLLGGCAEYLTFRLSVGRKLLKHTKTHKEDKVRN